MQATSDIPSDNASISNQRWNTRALIVDDDVSIHELLCTIWRASTSSAGA